MDERIEPETIEETHMALPTPFSAGSTMKMLRSDQHFVRTPSTGFDHLGALASVGEDEGDFDEFCSASRAIDDLCENDEQLAERIAVLLNRACAYGMVLAKAV